jgi:pimeloyl-ACP methyl ester carboxylesterase
MATHPQAVNESTYIMTKDQIPLRYVIHEGGTRTATHGKEPPIVFVLGYGMTLDEWPGLMISHLAKSHTVILYNHRGVSGIKNPDVPFTIRQGAIDLHDVIIGLAGENEECGAGIVDNCTGPLVDIVGYSMGGMIALEYAVMYPDTVNRLILLNTDSGGAERVPADEWVMERMSQTLKTPEENLDRAGSILLTESFRTTHPDPFTWFVDYGEVADPVAVQEQFHTFRSWEGVYADLPAIHARTLVITGDQDIVIPPENAVKIADQIPDATLIIRKGQAHGMIFVEPVEIAVIIEDFLG